MKKLKLNRETLRNLTNLDLRRVFGGMIRQSATTDEMGGCGTCGTLYGCNTRADRDCWGTYMECTGIC